MAEALKDTVRASSLSQAAAGFFAAGGGKAVEYVGAKVAKALKSGGKELRQLSSKAVLSAKGAASSSSSPSGAGKTQDGSKGQGQ